MLPGSATKWLVCSFEQSEKSSSLNRSQARVIYQAVHITRVDATDIQVGTLRDLFTEHGPRLSDMLAGEPEATSKPPASFADHLYSEGAVRPLSYCYLALMVRLMRLDATRPYVRARLWEEILHVIVETPPDQSSKSSADSQSNTILKNLAERMLQFAIVHYDYDELRGVLRWLHAEYRPYFRTLLTTSEDNESWLVNIAELLPRLLLKNLVPIYDSIRVRAGGVFLGSDGLFDDGTASRISSLYRTLFDSDELAGLAQDAQRASEVFANVGARIAQRESFGKAEDATDLLKKWEVSESSAMSADQIDFEVQILHFYFEAERLEIRQVLENEYRRVVTIPRFRYEELRGLLDDIDDGRITSAEAIEILRNR